jgi:hypothetical protein
VPFVDTGLIFAQIPLVNVIMPLFLPANKNDMFQQFIGDGANVFIAIAAVVVGFAAALGFTDFRKTTNKENEDNHHH